MFPSQGLTPLAIDYRRSAAVEARGVKSKQCATPKSASEGPRWRFALGVTAEICTQKRKSHSRRCVQRRASRCHRSRLVVQGSCHEMPLVLIDKRAHKRQYTHEVLFCPVRSTVFHQQRNPSPEACVGPLECDHSLPLCLANRASGSGWENRSCHINRVFRTLILEMSKSDCNDPDSAQTSHDGCVSKQRNDCREAPVWRNGRRLYASREEP